MPGSVTYAQPVPSDQQIPMVLRFEERSRSQRPQGTVYGGRPSQPATEIDTGSQEAPPGQQQPGQPAAENSAYGQGVPSGGLGPLPQESSGSLTGQITAQGRPAEARPRGSRAAIAMLITVAVIGVTASLCSILFLAGAV